MTVQTEGLAEAMRAVEGPGERVRDVSPALRASVLHWQHSEKRRFRRGWSQSAEWAREKRRRGLDARSMRATGQLESALVNANEGAGALVRVTKTTMVVGIKAGRSDIYYGRALAKGKPRRNAVAFDRKAKEATGVTVMHFLVRGTVQT